MADHWILIRNKEGAEYEVQAADWKKLGADNWPGFKAISNKDGTSIESEQAAAAKAAVESVKK